MNLLNGIWQGLALFGGVLVALAVAYLRGRSAGKAKAESTINRDALDRINEDKKRDNEIAGLSPAERDARGRRWVRPEPDR